MTNNYFKLFNLLLIVFGFTSCSTLNTLDFTDAVPAGKGGFKADVGVVSSTTYKTDVDTIKRKIVVNNNPNHLASVFAKGNIGVGEHFDLQIGINLPYLVGGFGAQLGLKYALFKKESNFNIAISANGFLSMSKDSMKVFGSKISVNQFSGNSQSFTVRLPISYKPTDDVVLTLSPQIGFNRFGFNDLTKNYRSTTYSFNSASLVLGAQIKKFVVQVGYTKLLDQNIQYPSFGIGAKI